MIINYLITLILRGRLSLILQIKNLQLIQVGDLSKIIQLAGAELRFGSIPLAPKHLLLPSTLHCLYAA